MSKPTPLTISYGRRANRRWTRWLALALVLAALAGLARSGIERFAVRKLKEYRTHRQAVARQTDYLRLQQVSIDFRKPPGCIAYDEDPAGGQNLLLDKSGYVVEDQDARLYWPPNIVSPIILAKQTLQSPYFREEVVPHRYLGGRKRPDGALRIVHAGIANLYFTATRRDVCLWVYCEIPASTKLYSWRQLDPSRTDEIRTRMSSSDRLRVYFGQPDATRESDFTLKYELNGVVGRINYRLANDGIVRLQVTGPLAAPAAPEIAEDSPTLRVRQSTLHSFDLRSTPPAYGPPYLHPPGRE